MSETQQSDDAHRNALAPMRPVIGAAPGPTTRGARRARAASPARIAVRPLIIFGLMALVIALLGVALLKVVDRLRPVGPPATPQALLRLTPLADGLKCVEQVAWSPNSEEVAVLGDTSNCGSSTLYSQSYRVFIYDAYSGQLIQQLQPDIDVVTSVDVRQALYDNWDDPHAVPALTYTNLVWTPDGAALLLPFEMRVAGVSHPDDAPIVGLLREAIHSDDPQAPLSFVWLNRLWNAKPGTLELWDLSLAPPPNAPSPTPGLQPPVGPNPVAMVALPHSETYHWTSAGALTTSGATANGAVGAPSGGQSFTIWQSGSLSYLPPSAAGGPAVIWSAKVAPVSPDSRYFYTAVPATGALVPPSTASAGAALPTLAPHDKALQALATQLGQVAASDATTPLLVSWRPDGRYLASVKQTPATTAGVVTVSIYDTTTGALVKQLTPDFSGLATGPASDETLQWSPDGKQLLFSDGAYGSVTLWGPGKLPA